MRKQLKDLKARPVRRAGQHRSNLMTLEILTADGYQLTLHAAPPLVLNFIRTRWQSGMTAGTADRLLANHGYVRPVSHSDRITGRCLGHQSTLHNWGEMRWSMTP